MAVTKRSAYAEQQFDRLSGLDGISDEQIREHLPLYAGYVRQVNLLNEELVALRARGRASGRDMRDYKATERGRYLDAFFRNIDWHAVERRLIEPMAIRPAAAA